ncbi:hypothetical protein Calag_1387 [Caldisphaera lagunensis DSM 15908]|uniref:Archaeal flagella assembly protein J n=1 Tax=Caldisphaera lagunensis (strain DSM 15908 / JCM 11604 / ANMR 0165 / IC-154) TaxID=1056495 RepID=L0AB59_CALLD|nr:hypothetical protein [Caldisphaera lagunensis]AFZ71096.1 hypothetical protein Calag_1387 [Caldisphaera lagunensis DSM 15908]
MINLIKPKNIDNLKIDIKSAILINKVSYILRIASFPLLSISGYFLHIHKIIDSIIILVFALLFFFSNFWITDLWLKLVDNGIENELPTLLAFLIPYAATTKNLVDLLLNIPKSLKLFYINKEIERLKLLLNFTQDSRKALSQLGETTPNARFRRLIIEHVQTETMGTSKNRITMLLYRYAILGIRDRWRNYTILGKELAEIDIGIMLSIGMLAVLMLLGNYNLLSILLLLGLFLIPISSIILILTRPKIGEPEGNFFIITISIISPLISSFLILRGFQYLSIVPFIISIPILEIYNYNKSKEADNALSYLRIASEKAKLGKRFDIELNKSKILAKNIIQGILESEKIAGKVGASNAIEGLRLIIEESRRLSNLIKAQSLFMISIALFSPLISIMAINIISNTFLTASQFLPINYDMVNTSRIIIASLSPLSTLPISILYRGKNPTLIPNLLSTLITLFVIR